MSRCGSGDKKKNASLAYMSTCVQTQVLQKKTNMQQNM